MLEKYQCNETLGCKIPIQDLIQSSLTLRQIFHSGCRHFGTTPYLTSRNTALPIILNFCLGGHQMKRPSNYCNRFNLPACTLSISKVQYCLFFTWLPAKKIQDLYLHLLLPDITVLAKWMRKVPPIGGDDFCSLWMVRLTLTSSVET